MQESKNIPLSSAELIRFYKAWIARRMVCALVL